MVGKEQSMEFLERVLRLSASGPIEARLTHDRLALTRFADSSIHQNMVKDAVALKLRVVIGKKIGTATVNSTAMVDVRRALGVAERLAKLQADDPDFVSLPTPTAFVTSRTYYTETAQCSPARRAEAVDALVQTAAAVKLRAYGSFATETNELAVASSLGVRAYNCSTTAYLRTVMMSAQHSGTGYADFLSRDIADIDPKALGEEAAERCVLGEHARELPPGEYEVVLTPYAVSDMIRFLGYLGFTASSMQEGRSFLSGRIGERVVGENISIWDDAFDTATLNMPFDLEGVAKRRVSLIEEGVAAGVVYDSYAAHKEGFLSTGHASRARGGMPANLVMAPGSSTLEEMVKSTKRGVYITRFHYTHCPDPVKVIMTGTTRDGTYLIENGEIKHPIKNLRLTDSVLRVLSHVSLISSERKLQRDWWGTFTSRLPALKAERCMFTGATTF
ncbi:MAG: Metalloprotease TldD [Firmicutes bacterium]|nr:Metalloprotease TldD [candidate division NPL-UPA2 bacterium]MBT9153678.1 Metalloprotease TldD [candidate division NPL-UPA2 bacterium]